MKVKKSTYLPLLLLAYMLFMAYMGRDLLYAGEYLYFFTVFGISLLVIVMLHFTLKKKEKLKADREQQNKKS